VSLELSSLLSCSVAAACLPPSGASMRWHTAVRNCRRVDVPLTPS
jgi:hypothetical protein